MTKPSIPALRAAKHLRKCAGHWFAGSETDEKLAAKIDRLTRVKALVKAANKAVGTFDDLRTERNCRFLFASMIVAIDDLRKELEKATEDQA